MKSYKMSAKKKLVDMQILCTKDILTIHLCKYQIIYEIYLKLIPLSQFAYHYLILIQIIKIKLILQLSNRLK